MTNWNANGAEPDPHIHEYRRQLLLYRGYFDDLSGFPAETQANILASLRELAELTGEPMLTNDQTEALVRERDTLRADLDKANDRLAEAEDLIRGALEEFAWENDDGKRDLEVAAARKWLGVSDG